MAGARLHNLVILRRGTSTKRRESMKFPEEYCGSLDYSKCGVQQASHAVELARHVQLTSHGDAHLIREVIFSNSQLHLLPPHSQECIVSSFTAFVNLQSLHLSCCGLCGDTLLRLMAKVLKLPRFFVMTAAAPPKLQRALLYAEVDLSGNRLTDGWLARLAHALVCPSSGVGKVKLCDSAISDSGVQTIAKLFPCTTDLHVSGNRAVALCGATTLLQSLPSLTLIDVDRCGVAAAGAVELKNAMQTRQRSGNGAALQVWMNAQEPRQDVGWTPLFDFCSAVSRDRQFTVKHDLAKGLGHHDQYAAACHDSVKVVLYLPNVEAVCVEHGCEAATRTVRSIAAQAVSELNAAVKGGGPLPRSHKARELRAAYERAVENVIHRLPSGGEFCVDLCRIVEVRARVYAHTHTHIGCRVLAGNARLSCAQENIYTGERRAVFPACSSLLGFPRPGCACAVRSNPAVWNAGTHRLVAHDLRVRRALRAEPSVRSKWYLKWYLKWCSTRAKMREPACSVRACGCACVRCFASSSVAGLSAGERGRMEAWCSY